MKKKPSVNFRKAPKRTYAHAYDEHGIGHWFYEEGKNGVGFGLIDCQTPSGYRLPSGWYHIEKPKKVKR